MWCRVFAVTTCVRHLFSEFTLASENYNKGQLASYSGGLFEPSQSSDCLPHLSVKDSKHMFSRCEPRDNPRAAANSARGAISTVHNAPFQRYGARHPGSETMKGFIIHNGILGRERLLQSTARLPGGRQTCVQGLAPPSPRPTQAGDGRTKHGLFREWSRIIRRFESMGWSEERVKCWVRSGQHAQNICGTF